MSYMVIGHDDAEFSSILPISIQFVEDLIREPECSPEDVPYLEKIIEKLRIIEATRSSGWGRAICIEDYYREIFEDAKKLLNIRETASD